MVLGLGSTWAVIVAATIDKVIGTTKMAPLKSADRTGRPCQRSPGVSSLDFLRSVTIAFIPFGVRTRRLRRSRTEGLHRVLVSGARERPAHGRVPLVDGSAGLRRSDIGTRSRQPEYQEGWREGSVPRTR